MRVRLLGSVDVVVGDRVTPVPGLRRQAVLAALALRRGTVVDKDLLVRAVWNGDPPATGVATVQSHVSYLRLAGRRDRAAELLVEARLGLGEHVAVLPELERLARERPFDERLHGHLIVALYRAGRQADALEAYQRVRGTLGTELGVDPGPDLRELEAAILRHDPALQQQPDSAAVPYRATEPAPAQLQAPIAAFTGRHAELARLDALSGEGSLPIAVIAGLAGAGKPNPEN